MAKKRKRKNILKSNFYRVYFVVVFLCVAAILIGARWLSGLLADYESAQPSHVAEATVRMFKNEDFESIYDYDTSAQELAGGDRDFYVESMREIAADKDIAWSEAYSSSEDVRHYNVTLGNEKFADISLVHSGSVTDHGFPEWKLDSVTTYVTLGEQEEPEPEPEPTPEPVPEGILCHITVPSDSAVTVNGVQLTADDASATGIPTASAGLLPEGIPSPTMTEYAFYSETGAPEIAVTDANGNPQEVTESGENSWACSLPESPELKELYEDAVVNVGKMIAQCAARTIHKSEVARLCAKNSPAQVSINNFDFSTGYSRKPARFENIVTSNYYKYSDTCFSCHVCFDYLSKFSDTVVKTYPTTLTLYFVYEGGKGKLYNFTLF